MKQTYPLTKQQEGLWVEWRLHPDNTSYNTCVKLKLTGDLDKERFEKALQHVVDFFASLRVYFVEEKGIPFQRIEDKGEYAFQYRDISIAGQDVESEEQAREAKAFLEDILRTPVDLKQFPIVRSGLIKTSPSTHYFIGNVPHMISDGGSAILFLEAASIAYNEGYTGLEQAYGGCQKSWGDYFDEQNQRYDENVAIQGARYWRKRLEGAQHVVDFAHGRQNTGKSKKQGKRVYFDLTPELSQALKDYSRSQRTTVFSSLVAAFSILVHRYYGQDDILIGYPVNIRPPGYKYLFGFFVNIIPIRVDLSGNPTYAELVARVSVARKSDKKFQTFPALDIVREIRKSTPGFDGRVFNVSMAQTVSRLVNLRLDGIHSEPLEAEYNDVNDDLSLSYELLEDGRIGLWLEYREGLFDALFIEQMIEHMQALLRQVVEAPDQAISHYRLLGADEEKQFIENMAAPDFDFNNVCADSIHGFFEQCAENNPQHTAIIFNDERYSYAQINARANVLAHDLIARGINIGDRVGVCLRRSPDLICSLLAVLKAGGVYVPIAPCNPQERIDFILSDADCVDGITHSDLLDKFSSFDENSVLLVDTVAGEKETVIRENPALTIKRNDECYIIYTSGSTGSPKGVLLTHGNVLPRLSWLQQEIPLGVDDVILQNTDYSFDVSVAEIFWPLGAGSTLVISDPAKSRDPAYLIELIRAHKVTASCMVPSLLSSVLAVLKDKADLSSLKYLLSAGEALPSSLVTRFYECVAGALYNIYGPTEAAIYASFKKCEVDHQAASVSIGRPIADTLLYIVDSENRPQPTGVAGELLIGGAGVAKGYVNRSALTAEKFISDPFFDDENSKVYRSGDLACFLSNGDIDYLGRIDKQVKIRGFRIELAEIESVLSGFGAIKDVAVVDFADGEHKRLVAYYVCDEEISQSLLKAYLQNKLPDYMVPSFFVSLKIIPRLTSGKINRRALPDPQNLISRRAEYVAPRNDTEQNLADIWARILKIPADKIGIHDSFFEIGGDSLLAIQFVCDAETQGIMFETDSVFEHKTVADLAHIARVVDDVSCDIHLDQIIEGVFPLLPRHAKFFADGFEHPNQWNRFFYFDVDHDVQEEHLRGAFNAVLMHHDNLRVSFQRDENGEYQQYCLGELPADDYVFFHDISMIKGVKQEGEIVKICNQYHAEIDLERAPLMRVVYFKTGDEAGKLAVIIHHMLIDIVSSRIIFEDVLKLYESLRRDIDIPLAAKTTSGKAWSEYMHDLIDSKFFKEELAYWGSEAMNPQSSLERDYPENQVGLDGSAAVEKVILSLEDTRSILQDIPSMHGIGIQNFLLAALLQTTKDKTGDDELLVNICGHGRGGAQGMNLSRTVAWLNSVYPVHLKYQQYKNASEFLQNVGDQIACVPSKTEYYNLLRYSARHPDILKYPTPRLFFNYVSQIDALIPDGLAFNPVIEPAGIHSSHPDNHLCYDLYMEAGIIEKCLVIHITYSTSLFKPETIRQFAGLFEGNIKAALYGVLNEKLEFQVAE